MDNRVWVKDAVMTIRLPEEVDHFVADRLREEAGEILVERNVTSYLILRRQILWTVRGLDW